MKSNDEHWDLTIELNSVAVWVILMSNFEWEVEIQGRMEGEELDY